MKYILTLLILFLFNFCFAQDESTSFKLIQKADSTDINYLTIKNINSLPHSYESMLQNFKPIKGEYTTYLFIKEFEDETKYFGKQKLHDLVIIKTNSNNIIIDGYFYRLEWSEVPSQSMIFRSFANNVELKNNISVLDLEFYNEFEMYNNQTEDELRRLTWCEKDKLEF